MPPWNLSSSHSSSPLSIDQTDRTCPCHTNPSSSTDRTLKTFHRNIITRRENTIQEKCPVVGGQAAMLDVPIGVKSISVRLPLLLSLFPFFLQLMTLSFFLYLLSVGMSEASSIVNIRRVTHPTIREPLAGIAHLPCVFTLQPSELSPSSQPPHIQWTRTWIPQGGEGGPLEQMVLSAKGK